MLELNISFIFHLFFIFVGCQVITFFLNKLYDSLFEYKEKESAAMNVFNTENNILKEKKADLEEKFNNDLKAIQTIINTVTTDSDISKKSNLSVIKNNIISEPEISEEKKKLINNYFSSVLKKFN
jgi:hypothetical protein